MALSQKTLVTLLSILMSEISEDAYASTWEMGMEFVIWDAVLGKPVDWRWNDSIGPQKMAMLQELSEEIGGWIVFDADAPDYTRFVPMQEWQEIYEAYVTESVNRQSGKGEQE